MLFLGILHLLIASFHAKKSSPQQLIRCINKHQPYEPSLSSWVEALDDKPLAVNIARAWWSRKDGGNVPLTIVTQLSLERLPQLDAQCKSYRGPISAALYIPLTGSLEAQQAALEAAIRRAGDFHAKSELSNRSCALDVLLAYENWADQNGTLLFPLNILRNYARLQARTRLIALYDVDLLVSKTLWLHLSQNKSFVDWLLNLTSGTRHRLEENDPPGLLILPAFISLEQSKLNVGHSPAHIAEMATLADKEDLLLMWHKIIDRFDPSERGHNATQYERWMTSSDPYEVKYEFRYEPWVIGDRFAVKWYDYRFRGYGQNKIVHLEHLNQSRFRFIVSPSAWLIHRPHSHAQTKLQHRDDFLEAQAEHKHLNYHTVFGHSTLLGANVSKEIRRGSYRPRVDQASVACSKRLPWWRSRRRKKWPQQSQE